MRTYLDCIPCFMKLALDMARIVEGNELVHKDIMNDVARHIPNIALGDTPPEVARIIHQIIEKRLGSVDIYKNIKKQSNRNALAIYPQLKNKVKNSENKLLTALEIAIAGNVIDYASKNSLDIDKEIKKIFSAEFDEINKTIFHFDEFKKDLKEAHQILYLADNAGEIVFDRVLLEEILKGKEIIFAVRERPVINDALMEDAEECGIDKIVTVISSGVDAPGTVLKLCSEDFMSIYKKADLIISKGQGNYEALNDEKENIYFLFRAKCPVIARHAKVKLGDMVLQKNQYSAEIVEV